MGHFEKTGNVYRVLDPEWGLLSKQVGELVRQWARRDDLTAVVTRGKNRSKAAAAFFPAQAQIELDTIPAFGEGVVPEDVEDFTLRRTHFQWPKATGAVMHEAMHAQYTSEEIYKSGLDKGPDYWLEMLDEPRIEGLGVRQYPENRQFLRACALEIVLADTETLLPKMTQTAALTQTAILSMGRVDSGVLEKDDIKRIREQILTALPREFVKALRVLWKEFFTLQPKQQAPRMYDIAKEIDRMVRERAAANGEKPMTEGDLPQWVKDLGDAMRGDATRTGFGAMDAAFEQDREEKETEAERERAQDRAEQDRNKQIGNNTFMDSNGAVGSRSDSRMVSHRAPTGAELAASNRVSEALRKAKYRERLTIKVNREIPPGRLNMNGAMQRTATRKSHNVSTAKPWQDTVRKHVEDPNLTVGLMCDISGSMTRAMQPIAVSVWMLSHAVNRIKGTCAAVYFGKDIFSVLKPGETLSEVLEYTAADNVEAFDRGFCALDGGLDLLHGTGPRLLFVCSDGQYGGQGERAACRKWLLKCQKAGVAVVWLAYKELPDIRQLCADTGAMMVLVGPSVTDAADAIGAACADALAKASK